MATKKTPEDHKAPLEIAGGREPIDVNLVGELYTIKPPKTVVSLKLSKVANKASENPDALLDALNDWLQHGFDQKTYDRIQERLSSDDDDLDIIHLVNLMKAVTEVATGNPST